MLRAASRLSMSAGLSLYASWKCLSAFTPARNFRLEDAPELEMELRLRRRSAADGRDSFLELLDQALPVPDVFQIRKMLL